MDWNIFLNSEIEPEYIVGSGVVSYHKFLESKKAFELKILTIPYVKSCTKKNINKLFKLFLTSKYREIPC